MCEEGWEWLCEEGWEWSALWKYADAAQTCTVLSIYHVKQSRRLMHRRQMQEAEDMWIPEAALDVIQYGLMRDPVMAADNHTCEKVTFRPFPCSSIPTAIFTSHAYLARPWPPPEE